MIAPFLRTRMFGGLLKLGLILLLSLGVLGYGLAQRSDARRDAEASLAIDSVLGCTVEPLDEGTAELLGVRLDSGGVVVTSLAQGGVAERAGFKPGDVVEQVADTPVASIEDLASALEERRGPGVKMILNRHGHYVTVRVRRSGQAISAGGAPARQGVGR